MADRSKENSHGVDSSERNTRLLRIKVVRAIGLQPRDIFGTSTDLYVKIILQTRENGNRTIASTRSHTVPKSINPVDPDKHRLLIEIYEQHKLSSDVFLGMLFVDLTSNIPYESDEQSASRRDYALLKQNAFQPVSGNATIETSFIRQATIAKENKSRSEAITNRNVIKPVAAATDSRLPQGWEERKNAAGRTYYIDHNTQKTTWDRPKFEIATAQQSHTKKNQTDELGPLSASRETTTIKSDRLASIDHTNERTTREDPGIGKASPSLAAQREIDENGPLPDNWEVLRLPDGRVYFVDHLNKKTSWTDPRMTKPIVSSSSDYESKYRTFRHKLPKPKPNVSSQIELHVTRKDIMQTSFHAIMNVENIELFKTKLCIVFDNERGSDHDNLSREWFYILSCEAFNPYYSLFQYCAIDNYLLEINPLSGIANEEHIKYFRFIGRIIGMAIYHEKLLSACFSRPFYKLLLSKSIILDDIESVDRNYYQSLKHIADNDPNDLEKYFMVNEEMDEHELKPGGQHIRVTEENKQEFIELTINYRFVKQIALQMNALKQGIQDIFPLDYLKMFDEKEVERLISGLGEIDLDDWRAHTIYKGGYTHNHSIIENFWNAVESFDIKERTGLFRFVTGKFRLPMNGFQELQGSSGPQLFTIVKWDEKTKLPRANNRFNRLYLPPYESYEDLREKLIEAIQHGATSQNEESIEEVEEISRAIGKAVITVEKGDITTQEVDAIISSSSSGSLKKALLAAAGSEIETDYNNEYTKNPNAILIPTKPGALHCKQIFFIKWVPIDDEQILHQSLIDLIAIVIQNMRSYNFTSIAFPAIGCGKHGCSRNIVIKTMVNEMKKELLKRNLSWTVKFVIQPDQ